MFHHLIPSVEAGKVNERIPFKKLSDTLYKILATKVYSFFSLSSTAFVANTSYIEIGYNKSVSFEIGQMDLKEQEFKNKSKQPIMKSQSITFEVLKYPSDNVDNRWRVTFDPPEVNFEKGTIRKTKVTLSLSAPPVGGEGIQSGELVIKVNRSNVYGDLWNISAYGIVWFLSALFPMKVDDKWQLGWGTLSGDYDFGRINVTVLVKVDPYHEATIGVPEMVRLQPNQIKTLHINITNNGNYKDTFGFRIESEGNKIALSRPIYVSLRPGETKKTLIGISSKPILWDSGSLHKAEIKVFSLDNPDINITNRTILIETKGFYVSELYQTGLAGCLMMIFFFVFIFIRNRKKQIRDIVKKPEKPWNISKEKEYLEQIRKKDRNQYRNILKQMKEEYNSALLWYKHYIKVINKNKKIKKISFRRKTKRFFSKILIWMKNESREEQISVFPLNKQAHKIKTKKDVKNRVKNDNKPTKKQKLIHAIKKEQARQQKKLGVG